MTPQEELELLIKQQRADDTHRQFPQRNVVMHLDKEIEGDEGDFGSLYDFFGDSYDFESMIEAGDYERMPERLVFMREASGFVLGADLHGTASTYVNRGCRCEACTKAHTDDHRAWSRRYYADPTNREKRREYQRARREAQRNPIEQQTCSQCGDGFVPIRRGEILYCSKKCRNRSGQVRKTATRRAARAAA